MRVVVDPNVLLSALIAPGGASDKAVRALAAGATLIVSEQLLDRFVQRACDGRFRRWFSIADARELADRLSGLGSDEKRTLPRAHGAANRHRSLVR